jgi:hypothetical protein
VVNRTIHGKTAATVTINEHPAITLLTGSGGVGPVERAQTTAARLQSVINSDVSSVTLAIQPVDSKTWAILLQGGSLVLATAEEAATHKTTVVGLAKEWQAALGKFLTEPPIHPSQSSIVVPTGEDRSIRIGGAARPSDINVQISDAETVSASFNASTRLLTIKGNQPGRVSLVLQSTIDGPASAQVTVDVMNYAAHIAPSASVAVTGSPAPPEIVQRAFYTGLARAVNAQPGATVHLQRRPEFKWPIYEGHSTSYTIPIRVDGPHMLPVQAKTVVTLTNKEIPARRAATLLYSNDPEQVTGGQTLFSSRIYPDMPARLDYHHQNISNKALGFHVDLENQASHPVSVLVYAGVSLPGIDTIQVGRRAGAEFMHAVSDGTGLVLTIPPYSALPIVTQRLPSLNTVSGLMELHLVSGDAPVNVMVYTDENDPPDPITELASAVLGKSWYVAPPSPLEHHAKPEEDSAASVFRWPHIEQDAEYDIGGQWTYLRLGNKDQLKDATGTNGLDGNYGADYNFTLTVKNPGTLPRPVGLYFAPEAGTAAGCFRVDGGPIVEFDPTSPPEEPLIQRYNLGAGESKIVHIWTIPLNGSYYPASIVVHAL